MTSNDLKDLLTEYIKISKNNLGVFKKHALLFPKKDPTFKKAWNKYGKENVSTKYTSHTGEKYLNKSTRKYADYRGLTIQRGSSTSGYISSGKLAPYIAFLNANQAVNDGIYPFYSYNPTGDVLYLMYAVSNKTPKPPKPTWNFSSAGKTLAGGVYKSYNCASINTWNYQQMLDELDDVIDDLEITLNITPRTARTDGKIGIGTGNIIPPAGSLPLHKTQSDSKHPLNLILYGPPGTGKTYNTLFHALAIIKGEDVAKLQEEVKTGVTTYENLKQEYDRYIDSKQIVFSTFHQSMSYEDFIEGIKPIPVEGNIVAIHKNDTKSTSTLFGDGTTTIANLSRMKYDVRD